jgi:hypothetical protein
MRDNNYYKLISIINFMTKQKFSAEDVGLMKASWLYKGYSAMIFGYVALIVFVGLGLYMYFIKRSQFQYLVLLILVGVFAFIISWLTSKFYLPPKAKKKKSILFSKD